MNNQEDNKETLTIVSAIMIGFLPLILANILKDSSEYYTNELFKKVNKEFNDKIDLEVEKQLKEVSDNPAYKLFGKALEEELRVHTNKSKEMINSYLTIIEKDTLRIKNDINSIPKETKNE